MGAVSTGLRNGLVECFGGSPVFQPRVWRVHQRRTCAAPGLLQLRLTAVATDHPATRPEHDRTGPARVVVIDWCYEFCNPPVPTQRRCEPVTDQRRDDRFRPSSSMGSPQRSRETVMFSFIRRAV